jgi:DNA repair protein RecN (Recombination protein N)
MLTTLRIKNLALVADLTLELQPGYNAITGETGAGKSIIIGALNLVLGERADRTLLRSGAESCSVEAVFDISRVRAPFRSLVEENGLEPCEENQLVLKRSFTATGTNRQFVNGYPTTLQVLAVLGEWLVDMHGPHDHPCCPGPPACRPRRFRQVASAPRVLCRIGPAPGRAGSGKANADRDEDVRATTRPPSVPGQ